MGPTKLVSQAITAVLLQSCSRSLIRSRASLSMNKSFSSVRLIHSTPSLHYSSISARTSLWRSSQLKIAHCLTLPPSKTTAQNGLSEEHVQLAEPALIHAVTRYTQEVGVHTLERGIGGVLRFEAVDGPCLLGLSRSSRPSSSVMSAADSTLIQSVRNGDVGYDAIVGTDQLEKFLGLLRHYREDRSHHEARCGAGVV